MNIHALHALLLIIIAGWDSRLGLELTFSRVTVKVLLDQVEQTLAVGGKEIGVLSQEVQSPGNSFVLHSRATAAAKC